MAQTVQNRSGTGYAVSAVLPPRLPVLGWGGNGARGALFWAAGATYVENGYRGVGYAQRLVVRLFGAFTAGAALGLTNYTGRFLACWLKNNQFVCLLCACCVWLCGCVGQKNNLFSLVTTGYYAKVAETGNDFSLLNTLKYRNYRLAYNKHNKIQPSEQPLVSNKYI